jgi:hypothetical protein
LEVDPVLKRTPYLGIFFGCVIALLAILLFQDDARPFTNPQRLLLLLCSIPPGIGLAMFLDPYPRRKKEAYLKVDFYKEDT